MEDRRRVWEDQGRTETLEREKEGGRRYHGDPVNQMDPHAVEVCLARVWNGEGGKEESERTLSSLLLPSASFHHFLVAAFTRTVSLLLDEGAQPTELC